MFESMLDFFFALGGAHVAIGERQFDVLKKFDEIFVCRHFFEGGEEAAVRGTAASEVGKEWMERCGFWVLTPLSGAWDNFDSQP